jgi:Uma2 family endonuclease
MAIQEQLHTVDDVWDLAHQPENDNIHFELIEGELVKMAPPGMLHGSLASLIAHHLLSYLTENDMGMVTVETGYYPKGTRDTLLSPDVAFLSKARLPQSDPQKYVPIMPDLAVEIMSPSDSLSQIRRKAAIYLEYGTELVWIVMPSALGVDVCRAGGGAGLHIDFVDQDGKLTGEKVLPGFELDLTLLFPSQPANKASE